jgi:hypothetical protein
MRWRSSGGHAGRRRLLDHLLVAALHRAVALEQIDALPWLSAKTWISTWRGRVRYFSMQHPIVAEGVERLALCAGELVARSPALLSATFMPLPPPPADRLDQHRIADLIGGFLASVAGS